MICHLMLIQPMERNIDDSFEDTHELCSSSSNTPNSAYLFYLQRDCTCLSILRFEFGSPLFDIYGYQIETQREFTAFRPRLIILKASTLSFLSFFTCTLAM